VTDTKTSNDNRSEISKSVLALIGLSPVFALGILVGLILVKDPEWLPGPVVHFLDLGNVYPTQGLIGPQKIIHDRESASPPSRSDGQKQPGGERIDNAR
jgi:hypothetical protein